MVYHVWNFSLKRTLLLCACPQQKITVINRSSLSVRNHICICVTSILIIMSIAHFTIPHQNARSQARQPKPLKYFNAKNEYIPLDVNNWMERWCLLPVCFERGLHEILMYSVRPQDVFIVAFMRSGATWMQEAAWLLLNEVNTDHAARHDIFERGAFLDHYCLFGKGNICQESASYPNPRLLKSHLPSYLLPRLLWVNKQKTIYVARNVKDVVTSCFHSLTSLGIWSGNIHEFVDDFINDQLWYGPYWTHVLEFWYMRHEPFIFFITYEEMKRDLAGVLKKLAKFLDKPELNEEDMQAALEHLSFKKMKENQQNVTIEKLRTSLPPDDSEMYNFMRRGIVGAYKTELNAEDQARLDAWTTQYLAKLDLKQEDIFGAV